MLIKVVGLQTSMMRLGLSEDQRRADFREYHVPRGLHVWCVFADLIVLTAEQACDIALEYGFNPTVDDERSFDILPE